MSRFDRNWHIHSTAALPGGGRVFVAHISSGHKWPTAAVLLVAGDELLRLHKDGRRTVLSSPFLYPEDSRPVRAEYSLREHVPVHWGSQHGSSLIVRDIPQRLLQAQTPNLGRLLRAWYRSSYLLRYSEKKWPLERQPLVPGKRPVAITTIPCTDVVIRALHEGVLLERLKLGLERIYVSEYAILRAPSIEAPLRALAKRFPDRLIVVPHNQFAGELITSSLRLRKPRAAEFVAIGYELNGAYDDDFGYCKYRTPDALDGMFRFRVGDVPRGVILLIAHEHFVGFDKWRMLDVEAMQQLEDDAASRFREQEGKAIAMLSGNLIENEGRK